MNGPDSNLIAAAEQTVFPVFGRSSDSGFTRTVWSYGLSNCLRDSVLRSTAQFRATFRYGPVTNVVMFATCCQPVGFFSQIRVNRVGMCGVPSAPFDQLRAVRTAIVP